jgi:hypothetical protein
MIYARQKYIASNSNGAMVQNNKSAVQYYLPLPNIIQNPIMQISPKTILSKNDYHQMVMKYYR